MQVKKRDGTLEEMDRNKLKSSFLAAGVAEEIAEALTSKVEIWAMGAAEDGVISAPAIWDKAAEVLEVSDPGAAARYKTFRGQ